MKLLKESVWNDYRTRLSTLWVFAILNYLYADVLSFYEPGILEELMTGSIGGIEFTHTFLLVMSVMMETAIIMVVLSRFLKRAPNRILNIIAGSFHTIAVFSSMFVGSSPSYSYMFFGIVEIFTTV